MFTPEEEIWGQVSGPHLSSMREGARKVRNLTWWECRGLEVVPEGNGDDGRGVGPGIGSVEVPEGAQ